MVITLVGSARFEGTFHEVEEQLTLAGHVVIGLAVYPSQKGGDKDWYDEETKKLLDLVHLAKIEESDAVVVVNPGGYVGESTAREVRWAEIRGKKIYSVAPTVGVEDWRDLTSRRVRISTEAYVQLALALNQFREHRDPRSILSDLRDWFEKKDREK